MIIITNELTGRVYWKDDDFGWESRNKAQMFMDAKDLYLQRKNKVGNDTIYFVRTRAQLGA